MKQAPRSLSSELNFSMRDSRNEKECSGETLLGSSGSRGASSVLISSIVQYVRRQIRVSTCLGDVSMFLLRACTPRRRSSDSEIVARSLQRKISTLRRPREIEFIFELSCARGGRTACVATHVKDVNAIKLRDSCKVQAPGSGRRRSLDSLGEICR